MTLLVAPTSFTFAGSWTSFINSGGGDGLTYQEHTASSDHSWMKLNFSLAIDPTWTITGLEISANAGDFVPGGFAVATINPPTLELGIANGSGAVTSTNIVRTGNLSANAGTNTISAGSSTSTWDMVLTPANLNATNFGVFVRRSVEADEDLTANRYTRNWQLTIFYNTASGSFMPLHRTTVHQNVYFGQETTPQTAVATPNRFVACEVWPQPKLEFKEQRGLGNKLPTNQLLIKDWCELALAGYLTYNELGVVLSTLIGVPTTTLIPGSVSAYRHSYLFNPFAQNPTNTLTVTRGDSVRADTVTGGFFHDLKLGFSRKDITLAGSGAATALQDGTTLPTGINNVQTITFGGTPSGGTFTLMFRQVPTAAISWSATSATLLSNIQTALNALPNIGAAGIVVSGTGPYTVTFSGTALAGQPQMVLEVPTGGNNLTGTSPTISIAQATPGGFTQVSPLSVSPRDVSLYIAPTYATLSSNLLPNAYVGDLDIVGLQSPFWTLNSANNSFGGSVEKQAKIELKVRAEADSVAMANLTRARAQGIAYQRLACISQNLIDGTNPFRMQFDMPVKISGWSPFADEEGVYATEFTTSTQFDPVQGYAFLITIDNDNPNW